MRERIERDMAKEMTKSNPKMSEGEEKDEREREYKGRVKNKKQKQFRTLSSITKAKIGGREIRGNVECRKGEIGKR